MLFYIHGQSREGDNFVQYIRGYNKRRKVGNALPQRPESCYEFPLRETDRQGYRIYPVPALEQETAPRLRNEGGHCI